MRYLFLVLLLPATAQASDGLLHSLVLLPMHAAQPALLALAIVAVAALALALIVVRRSAGHDERARTLQQLLAAEREARADADHALAENSEALFRLASQPEGMRDGERRRVAQELNAGLGNSLLALRTELARLAGNAEMDPRLTARLDGALAKVDGTLAAVRAAAGEKRAPTLKEGLRPAVERSLRDHARLTGLRYRFEAGVDPSAATRCDKGARLAAFALLQEVLGDKAGFAQDELRVRLTEGARQLVLELEGGRTPALVLPEHLRERIHALGGRLELALLAPGKPRVTLSLPVKESAEAL